LILSLALTPRAFAQSSFTWNGGAANNNWSTAANWGGFGPGSPQAILHFAGSTRLINTNDFAANSAGYQILFDSGASSLTNWGNAIKFFDFGGNFPKIENNSANASTVVFPIVIGNTHLEINPVQANLNVNSPGIDLGSFQLQIWGNNSRTVSFSPST